MMETRGVGKDTERDLHQLDRGETAQIATQRKVGRERLFHRHLFSSASLVVLFVEQKYSLLNNNKYNLFYLNYTNPCEFNALSDNAAVDGRFSRGGGVADGGDEPGGVW